MGSVTRWALALIAMLVIAFVALDIFQKGGEDSVRPSVRGTTPAGRGESVPERPLADRQANARSLVAALSRVDLAPGALTPEKAEEWRRNLMELLAEGTAAVPAIGEYLGTNADIRFDTGPAESLLGHRTLRLALLRTLFDIPTPDNVNLQAQVLQTAEDPDEVFLLAQQLEMQEPRKHREAIARAARASLELVRQGKFAGRDTSALSALVKAP